MFLKLVAKFFLYVKNYGFSSAFRTAFFYGRLLINKKMLHIFGTPSLAELSLNKVLSAQSQRVAVVVSVQLQSEVEGLQKSLTSICEQSYKNFQIYLVGQISNDHAAVMRRFAQKCEISYLNSSASFWYEQCCEIPDKESLTWIYNKDLLYDKKFLETLVNNMRDESVMWSFCGVDCGGAFNEQENSFMLSHKQFMEKFEGQSLSEHFIGNSLFRNPIDKQKLLTKIKSSLNSAAHFFAEISRSGAICFSAGNKSKSLQPISKGTQIFSANVEVSKPHIAMCSTGFISGGGETFPIRLANFLKRSGYPVTFLNFDFYPRNEGIRRMLDGDVPVVNLQSIRSLPSVVENYGFDIIHSHNATIDIVISEANLSRVKHVVTLHGMYESKGQEHLSIHIPRLFKTVSQWVYTTDKNLEAFKNVSGFDSVNFTKIGNGIEIKPIEPVKLADYGIPEDSFVVCLASRAIKEKGWAEAIEIVGEARKRTQKDIRLILLGDGPLYEHYKKNSPGFATCVGFQGNVAGFFASSDIFLFPTTFAGESFPLVILDSLAAGTPVIATDIGEIANMITSNESEKAGDIFQMEQNGTVPISAATNLLIRYVNDSSYLEAKSNLAKKIINNFDLTKTAKKYLKVYDSLFI
jgi:glycosyltransferase involved in cell wall biosynthesis